MLEGGVGGEVVGLDLVPVDKQVFEGGEFGGHSGRCRCFRAAFWYMQLISTLQCFEMSELRHRCHSTQVQIGEHVSISVVEERSHWSLSHDPTLSD